MSQAKSWIGFSELTEILESGNILGDGKSLQLSDPANADLDLPNILVIYALPFPLDKLREQYRKAQRSIHVWQSWEAARTEGLVQDQIKAGNLPGDLSFESKLRRTAYRAKGIEFLRDQSIWLSLVSSGSGSGLNNEYNQSEANTAILKFLSNKLPHEFGEVEILFRPISREVLSFKGFHQQYQFTFVRHTYDQVSGNIITAIPTVFFAITVTDGSNAGKVHVSAQSVETTWNFVHRQWEKEEGKIDQGVIRDGETLLAKRQLALATVSTL